MNGWTKLDDKLPPDGVVIEVAEYAGRAELARYELSNDRFKYGLDQLYYRRRPTLWRLYQGRVAPTKLEIDSPSFAPTPESNEPGFMLVGRDPIAPILIVAWAYMRMGQFDMASRSLGAVLELAQKLEPQRNDDPQIMSAFRVAREMEIWANKKAVGG